jgi:hypothetical protein
VSEAGLFSNFSISDFLGFLTEHVVEKAAPRAESLRAGIIRAPTGKGVFDDARSELDQEIQGETCTSSVVFFKATTHFLVLGTAVLQTSDRAKRVVRS